MPTTDSNQTRADRYVAFLKNHKIFSVVFIVALGIIAAASVLKSSHEIVELVAPSETGKNNLDRIAESTASGLNVVIVLPDMDYEGADKDLDIAISLKLTLEKVGKKIVIKNKDIGLVEQQLQSLGGKADGPSVGADYVVLIENGFAKVVNASTAEIVYVDEAFPPTR